MAELQTHRRLVKSPPELWAEVSDAASLARHLGEVGEITITRLKPETTVAWEGERASGTVEIEPAGWGTKVTLTAERVAVAQPEPVAEPEPEPNPEPAPKGFRALLRRWRRSEPVPPEPVVPEPEPEPAQDDLLTALTAALDSLGAAHHRPFSRG
jgi:hypothetical protein